MLSVFMLIFQFINSQNRIIIRPQRVNQFQELLTLFGEFHVSGPCYYLLNLIGVIRGDINYYISIINITEERLRITAPVNIIYKTGKLSFLCFKIISCIFPKTYV